MTVMLRFDDLKKNYGLPRGTVNEWRYKGLFPPPVNLVLRVAAFPKHEIEAVVKARIAGASNDEIKALVQKLIAGRKQVGV